MVMATAPAQVPDSRALSSPRQWLRPGFSLLHEAPITHQVLRGSWCPTMDLLALLSEDGSLAVQRLDAQKLWAATLSDVRQVTTLCWRPDGGAQP